PSWTGVMDGSLSLNLTTIGRSRTDCRRRSGSSTTEKKAKRAKNPVDLTMVGRRKGSIVKTTEESNDDQQAQPLPPSYGRSRRCRPRSGGRLRGEDDDAAPRRPRLLAHPHERGRHLHGHRRAGH